MSPIEDPSYAARRYETREKELAAAERARHAEYVKPLVMLVVGAGTVVVWRTLGPGLPVGLLGGLVYIGIFVVSLVFGLAGLWACSNLWLGGAGPLGLGLLRLAGVYGMTDLVGMLTASWSFMSWFVQVVVYVVLLAWLFELELMESIVVAIVTFLLKVIVGIVLVMVIGTIMA